jgi:hypothetical protein
VYYGKLVLDEYSKINNRSDELRNISVYGNMKPDSDKLSPYAE